MDDSKEPMPENDRAVVLMLTTFGRADIAQLLWMRTAGAGIVTMEARNYLGSDTLDRRPLDPKKVAILDTLSVGGKVVGYHLTITKIPAMYWLAKVAPEPRRGIMNLTALTPAIMGLAPLAARLPGASEYPGEPERR